MKALVKISSIVQTLNGLLEIAEQAMPDTYFAEDTRIILAKRLIKKLDGDVEIATHE